MTGFGAYQTGMYFYDADNCLVKNNTIYLNSTTGWGDGISVSWGTGGKIIGNTVYQGVDGSSILLWDLKKAVVEHNKVYIFVGWSTGIISSGTTGSMIQYNEIVLFDSGMGITLQSNCKSNEVNENTIKGYSNSVYGININFVKNRFRIMNNTVTITGTNSYGLRCEYSSKTIIYGLNVTLLGQFSTGISIWYSDNISIYNSEISTDPGASSTNGIWMEYSGDIDMGDITIDLKNNFGSGIQFSTATNKTRITNLKVKTNAAMSTAVIGTGCFDVILINSSLSAAAADDVTLDQGAWLILLNCTYSDLNIIDIFSQLIVGWYLNVHVIDNGGSSFPNVNVKVERDDGVESYSGTANSNGWCKWIPCLGYIRTKLAFDNSTNPHVATVSNATCFDNATVDMTLANRVMTIMLANDDPVITNQASIISVQEDSEGKWDFNATDKENNPLVWSINPVLSWIDFNTTNGKLSVIPDDTHVGNHDLNIRVTDINSGYDEFSVELRVRNRDPVIQTANVLTATEDSLYSVDYDSDDDPSTTWNLVNGPDWLEIDENTGVLNGTPDNADVGDHWVNMSVEDGNNGLTWNNFTITVNNNPPTILTSAAKTAAEDQQYQFDYSSSDDGQGTITWSIISGPSWLSIDPATGILSGTPTNAHVQQWAVSVGVDDGNGGTDVDIFTLTVTNAPPEILTQDDEWADEDSEYEVDYDSSDDEQGTIIWSLSSSAENWLKIDAETGLISGIPRNEHVGTYWVNVTVKDGNGGIDWTNFTHIVNNTNDAPKITAHNVLIATEDTLYSVSYDAKDDDSDTLNWALTTDASWLSIDPATGELSGTPTYLDLSTWDVTVLCDDGNGGNDSHTFTITVLGVNDPPVIDSYSPLEMYPTVEEGLGLEFNITYSDEDSNIFTVVWTLDGKSERENVPFWTFVPEFDTEGDHEIIVNVTDGGSASVEQRWIVIVTAANRAPTINEYLPTNLKPTLDPDTSSLTFTINATDPDDEPVTYEWYVNGVDTGIRTRTFDFNRYLYDPGSHNVSVKISDNSGAQTEQTWTVDVEESTEKKTDDSDWLLYILIIVLIVIIVILALFFLLKKRTSKIEDIFLISNGGVLLAHKSKELRPDRDEDILSGMLTAIQDFVKDAFTDQSKSGLKKLEFGDSVIHLRRGTGKEEHGLDDKLDKAVKNIETEYGDKLKNWNGKLNDVSDIKDQLDILLK
jgi:hypothetical protein